MTRSKVCRQIWPQTIPAYCVDMACRCKYIYSLHAKLWEIHARVPNTMVIGLHFAEHCQDASRLGKVSRPIEEQCISVNTDSSFKKRHLPSFATAQALASCSECLTPPLFILFGLSASLTQHARIVCQVYAMEVAPDRIRGGMVAFQYVWYV